MNYLRNLDLLSFDDAPPAGPDEDLPDYEPRSADSAPDYFNFYYETPLITYHLRQVDRKLQVFVTYGPSASSSYKVITNTFRLFGKKKPEMEVIHVSQETLEEKNVGSICFDHDSPLPWRPRAHVIHNGEQGQGKRRLDMESKNFNDWTVVIDNIKYIWTLEARPSSLVLKEQGVDVAIARFIYSSYGTMAEKGAEVGELTVYREVLSEERGGMEKIICGLMVAIVHLKRMGRHYNNEDCERQRAASFSAASLPRYTGRGSVASSSDLRHVASAVG